MTARKTYTAEFKRQAIELSNREDMTMSQTSVSASVLFSARRKKPPKRVHKPFQVKAISGFLLWSRKSQNFVRKTKFYYKSVKFSKKQRPFSPKKTESGFHTWRKKPLAKRHQQDEQLKISIQRLYDKHKGNYGVPRIHAQFAKDGCQHSKKCVARLMSALGLYGKIHRQFVKTTICDSARPVAGNTLKRQFNPERPNMVLYTALLEQLGLPLPDLSRQFPYFVVRDLEGTKYLLGPNLCTDLWIVKSLTISQWAAARANLTAALSPSISPRRVQSCSLLGALHMSNSLPVCPCYHPTLRHHG